MSITFLNQLGLIPALLIALAGTLMLRGDREHARRRLLLFFLGLGTLLLSALYVTMRFITEPYEQPFFQLASLLTPSLLGIMALILLNIKGLADMSRRARVISALLGMAMLVLYILFRNTRLAWEYLILPGTLILAIGWSLFKRYGWLGTVLGLVSMVVLFFLNWLMTHPPDYANSPLSRGVGSLIFVSFYVVPGLSVVVAAAWITAGLQSFQIQDGGEASARLRLVGWVKIGLALVLLLYLAYTIFWGSVWDHTSDGLTGLFILHPSALVAAGAGMTMTLALRGRPRLAGLLFMIAAPMMFYQSFETGWRVSYQEITEKRAARIARALDRFHAREGAYPEALDQLTPRDLLLLQPPVILAGEGWCYEGGGNQYGLAAFHREFFSSPVSLRIYASAGDLPVDALPCASRLAEMKEKYYSPMEDPAAMRPPVPTPVPEIEAGMPKIPVQPMLHGAVALPGSWSPDSAYFVFGTQNGQLTLHFLSGGTGGLCSVDAQFSRADDIREKHAWLPDGKLLYVDSTGEVTVIEPCQPGVERVTDRLHDRFTQITAYEPATGRVLLQSEAAFWILDGRTMEMKSIRDVTPNPYDLHWDRSAWLPGGEKLVIARLNGRKGSNAGATLSMIDAGTGEIQNSLELEGDFGQSAPWIEGLSQNEVLLHGQGKLLVADFGTIPVKLTDVMESIFGLDIQYPDEVSAAGSHINKDGKGYTLSVRLNHPHNQATYLYDSAAGSVHVYNHEYHTLLLFPDGYLMEMARQELEPTYTDEYDTVFVDEPEAIHPRLVFTGHTPREYPHLSIAYLAERSQLAIASAHGVSLVSLPEGKLEAYWSLPGAGYSPWLIAAPDGSALVASKDLGGLYYLPLP